MATAPLETASDDATTAYERRYGNILNNLTEVALSEIRAEAIAGNAAAQTAVGKCYQEGICVPQDSEEARRWYLFAANQGFVEAQFAMGRSYCPDDNTDSTAAILAGVEWYERAAQQGHLEAQFSLGILYTLEIFLSRPTFERACDWLCKAALSGHEAAQMLLLNAITKMERTTFYVPEGGEGDIAACALQLARNGNPAGQCTFATYCVKGYGVPVDVPTAKVWYEAALAHGGSSDFRALYPLARILESGWQGVAADSMRAAELYYAAALSAWIEPFDDEDDCDDLQHKALYRAGLLFETSNFPDLALRCYKLLSDESLSSIYWHKPRILPINPQPVIGPYAQGLYRMARLYDTGSPLSRNDVSLSAKYYSAAASRGHQEAPARLQTIKEDPATMAGLERAAAAGDTVAQRTLGRAFADGLLVQVDTAKSKEWLWLSAQAGDADAQAALASLLAQEIYVTGGFWGARVRGPGDPAVVLDLYNRAAVQGQVDAQRALAGEYGHPTSGFAEADEQKSIYWSLQAALQGDVICRSPTYYTYRVNTNPSWFEGYESHVAEWVLERARFGSTEAQYTYAKYCETGYGIPVNIAAAVQWYEAALAHYPHRKPNPDALLPLARILEAGGEGVPAKPARAAELYRNAGTAYFRRMPQYAYGKEVWEQYADALLRAGAIYEGGITPPIMLQARKCYTIVSTCFSESILDYIVGVGTTVPPAVLEARFRLGRMYEEGRTVARSVGEALKLYKAAAGRGHVQAQERLSVLASEGHESDSGCIIM